MTAIRIILNLIRIAAILAIALGIALLAMIFISDWAGFKT
jgi:hypothetical protein